MLRTYRIMAKISERKIENLSLYAKYLVYLFYLNKLN